MPTTIKSICDRTKDKLCKPPFQDFSAATIVRDMQRVVDPEGTKKLNREQAKTLKAFLDILVATAS